MFNRFSSPIVLALLLTIANVFKPVLIDDTAYLAFARHIAEHPLDPYGFHLIWYQNEQPAFTLLAPPVMLYWLAPGIRLFGEEPILWKLTLFPFSWLLTWAAMSLFRRFASGLERPLTAMTVLSPVILPGFNLMLDVPAFALALGAIALFIRIVDRAETGSLPLNQLVLVGLLAGLAMQTKYTALLCPIVIVTYSLIVGRIRAGVMAGVVAAVLFIGWERLMIHQYGESHFLYHLQQTQAVVDVPPEATPIQRAIHSLRETISGKLALFPPLAGYLGGLASALLLVGTAILRWNRFFAISLGVISLQWLLLTFESERWAIVPRDSAGGIEPVTLSALLMAAMGAALLIVIGRLLMLLYRSSNEQSSRDRLFLSLWLMLEIVGYFALSPFPAARRVMGLFVVVAIFQGYAWKVLCPRATNDPGRHDTSPPPPANPKRLSTSLKLSVALGVGMGILFSTIDFVDATQEKAAVRRAASIIQNEAPSPRVWFVGHWGFKYYAEQHRMVAVLPGQSVLDTGDWLVVPELWENSAYTVRPYGQKLDLAEAPLETTHTLEQSTWMPWRTFADYYCGTVPVRNHEGPRIRLTIYRVRDRWNPKSFP
jgi:hypothetical protein